MMTIDPTLSPPIPPPLVNIRTDADSVHKSQRQLKFQRWRSPELAVKNLEHDRRKIAMESKFGTDAMRLFSEVRRRRENGFGPTH